MEAKEFATILKEQMAIANNGKGISVWQLAVKLGVTPTAVYYWLGAKGKAVTRGTVLTTAEALGVSASVFFAPQEVGTKEA